MILRHRLLRHRACCVVFKRIIMYEKVHTDVFMWCRQQHANDLWRGNTWDKKSKNLHKSRWRAGIESAWQAINYLFFARGTLKSCEITVGCAGDPSLVLILKWGGELTPAGRIQAEELGRMFRCMYPGGQGRHIPGRYSREVVCWIKEAVFLHL